MSGLYYIVRCDGCGVDTDEAFESRKDALAERRRIARQGGWLHTSDDRLLCPECVVAAP